MKKFITPECEMIALEEKDVIVTSNKPSCTGAAEGGQDCQLGYGA